jgi:hypothetical protein
MKGDRKFLLVAKSLNTNNHLSTIDKNLPKGRFFRLIAIANMERTLLYILVLLLAVPVILSCTSNPAGGQQGVADNPPKIQLLHQEDAKKVDVVIDGQFFTAFIYPDTLEKQVLYPIVSANGKILTRGFPINPKPGERVDHPHHIGLWFNYGDVNGLDFWNNSSAIPADRKHRYGTIVHQSIDKVESGNDQAVLEATNNWITPDGKVLLVENTSYRFSARGDSRIIERTTKLTAQDIQVRFDDNKEGVIAVRVAREMEIPSDRPARFTDAMGIPTKVPVLNNEGVMGNYLSSEGIEGDDVWGTRAKWVKMYSKIDGEPVSITIIDHPQNPGYPTYWHARGYGLFSANPLGQSEFSKGKEKLNFKLEPGESTTFKHRIVVHSGSELSAEEINRSFEDFQRLL